MKKLFFIILLFTISSARGDILLKVCQTDGVTPFDCNDDVMVGGKISFVVSSDSNDYWSGGLFIADQNRNYGLLLGRGYDPNTRDYNDSHFTAAGEFAKVYDWVDSLIEGFDLYTFYPEDNNDVDANFISNSTLTGDWFIIDYKAEQIGQCDIGFYEYFKNYQETWSIPSQIITLNQVVTRDFDSDGSVDFNDFAYFSNEWSRTDCADHNYCNGADLDFDGDVDCNDLYLFTDFWMWGEQSQQPIPPEPNQQLGEESDMPPDPNIIYRIVDANGSDEITIDVGQTITLYVDMDTNDVNVISFDIEVNISDTNLGSIDNIEYDSSNPPGEGSARILALPATPFIYWGPGVQQTEGIEFLAASWDGYFYDGYLVSFEFTCQGPGDVILSLKNWQSFNSDAELVFPTLESMVIHQCVQTMMSSGGGSMEMSSTPAAEQELTEVQVGELTEFLEDLWQDEEVRENISREELDEFVDQVEQSVE